ncbi:ankyrin repeat domain-containing protein [Actinomadura sp. LD22]|uniref:Ankyrin repeat domain-containing protein n=1 Tax=Actinomadura physcomitrii TaxID=2650748 RepID=A0A6I4M7S2_9ACTN|nr:ankyrin repeat domain-containing protein [Actinomadura physcomitrii]MWA01040.1 ankyrin repeat domain-containing protein [Actinomadura physcomitrii]
MTRPRRDPSFPSSLRAWRQVRRLAVPRGWIERAAERRAAGDWRGACAAANVDVAFDLADAGREFGADVRARLEKDLRHLVPDLLHWHLPRDVTDRGGLTALTSGFRVVLARYGTSPRGPVPALSVTAPPSPSAPQRLTLEFGVAVREWADWSVVPYLFDDRHHRGLLGHYGGDVRAPFFAADGTPRDPADLPASDLPPSHLEAGDRAARSERSALLAERPDGGDEAIAAAFAAAGIGVIVEQRPGGRPTERQTWSRLALLAGCAPMLAHQIERVTGGGTASLSVRLPDHRFGLHVEAGGRHRRPLLWVATPEESRRRRPSPGCWHALPDLALLRAGLVAPDELHPLVRSALFPARPAPDRPAGPPDARLPPPVRVRCQGEWHLVRSGDGGLRIPHADEERRREQALGAFGGTVNGCFVAHRTWRTGTGWLPRALRAHRREVFLRAAHGDTEGVLRLLDAGLDPRVRDGRRWTLLHALYAMDHEVLLPRLLDAGLDLDATDCEGLTPVLVAVLNHGSPAFVRALLDAGASPRTPDGAARAAGRPDTLPKAIERAKREDLEFVL